MNIVRIEGGLGNQMLQYIFVRYLEITNSTEVYIDISHKWLHSYHNGFELDKIFPNIKLRFFSDLFDEEIYSASKDKIADRKSLLEGLNELGISKVLLICNRITSNTAFSQYNENNYRINNCELEKFSYIKNRYFAGNYFDNHLFNKNNYFLDKIKEQMIHELEFQAIPQDDVQNIEYLEKIKSTTSVAVHVRRGDYVKLGRDLGPKKYYEHINAIREEIISKGETPHFFIMTNDPEWMKDNIQQHGFLFTDNIILVEGNMVDAKNYIDMQLMSHCKYIIANFGSTFAKCAGLLNKNLVDYIQVR